MSEIDKYITNNFKSIDVYLSYDEKILKSQKDIIDYFSPFSDDLSNICDNMIYSDMSWSNIISSGVNILNDHLIKTNNNEMGIHPGIDAFLTFYKSISNNNSCVLRLDMSL